MSVTAEQNRLNLRTASRNVARAIGYDAATFDPKDFTFDQRTAYVHALAAYIADRPQLFTDGTLATAANVSAKDYGSIADTAPTFDAFADAFIDEALAVGQSVASVGEGVKTGLKLTRYLIPAALVAAALIGLYGLKKKVA